MPGRCYPGARAGRLFNTLAQCHGTNRDGMKPDLVLKLDAFVSRLCCTDPRPRLTKTTTTFDRCRTVEN